MRNSTYKTICTKCGQTFEREAWRCMVCPQCQVKGSKRYNLQEIFSDPVLRRKIMVGCIIATQAHEGLTTTQEQAEAAYDKILKETK